MLHKIDIETSYPRMVRLGFILVIHRIAVNGFTIKRISSTLIHGKIISQITENF